MIVTFWIFMFLIITVLSPILRCGWTILVMAVFWISECLPLAITSLLPLVLLPLAGVSGTKEVFFVLLDYVLATFSPTIQTIYELVTISINIHNFFR